MAHRERGDIGNPVYGGVPVSSGAGAIANDWGSRSKPSSFHRFGTFSATPLK